MPSTRRVFTRESPWSSGRRRRRYFIELGMGLCEQVYFDPALVDIIDGAFYYWNELKAKTLKLLPKWC